MSVKTIATSDAGVEVKMKTNNAASEMGVEEFVELFLRHYVDAGYYNNISIAIGGVSKGVVVAYVDPLDGKG